MKFLRHITAAAAIALFFGSSTAAQEQRPVRSNHRSGLSEIQYRDRALLIVLRARVVSADQSDRAILDLVLNADPSPKPKLQLLYTGIAKKLNKYINKYKSLSGVSQLNEADCIIFFNLVEYRRILNAVYPFGELFVIIKGTPEHQRPPRVIWKSRKVLWAADAVDEFLRDLKNVRGES